MRNLKRILTVALVIVMVFCMAGCGGHSSHFRATMMIRNNTSKSAFTNFHKMEGTLVFKLNNKNVSGKIKYSGRLEKGSATVYYEIDGAKKELFTVGEGGNVSATLENVGKGKIYVFVETNGKCEGGDFQFDLE